MGSWATSKQVHSKVFDMRDAELLGLVPQSQVPIVLRRLLLSLLTPLTWNIMSSYSPAREELILRYCEAIDTVFVGVSARDDVEVLYGDWMEPENLLRSTRENPRDIGYA